jgi:aminoglycoside phosphotransferase (APT) family kinase protein
MSVEQLVDVVDSSAELASLTHPPLLVRDRVAAVLDAAGLGAGPVRETQIGDGHSNVTFLLERDGWTGVLRRPPRPPYHPKAHDMVREAQVQTALAGTTVPVPEIELVDPTGDVLGVPFYVMERLDGHVITAHMPPGLDEDTRRHEVGLEVVRTLADLHTVPVDRPGLRELGRGEHFSDRQLATFGALWESHRTRELPAVDEAERWLREHRPPPSGPPTLVHGDYRLGNLMWAPGPGVRLVALLDWELATIGEPLSDLGYLLSTYPEGPHDGGALLSLAGAVAEGGFPSRRALVEAYARQSDRDLGGLDWWVVLAFWRTAVGLESFYRRGLEGTTVDPFILALEHGVPVLAEQALAAIEGAWT